MFTQPLDRLVRQILARLTRETGLPQTEQKLRACAQEAVGPAATPGQMRRTMRRLLGSGQVRAELVYTATNTRDEEPPMQVRQLAVAMASHLGARCFSVDSRECCVTQERYLAAAAVALGVLRED